MATGIQTGLRTGSSLTPPGKPGPQGGVGKVLASWNSLAPRVKILAVVGVLALVIGGAAFFGIQASNAPVQLYQFTLSETDQKEVIGKLTEMGERFDVQVNKIMVAPSRRRQLAATLMSSYGLPHRPLNTNKQDGGMIPPSDKEKEQMRLEDLQARLIEQMRVLNFVADAYVQIVPADEEAALMGQAKPATAQVLLILKPGQEPNHEQVDAIVSMVSYSVRGMLPENVKVVTDQGKVLNNKPGMASAGSDSSMSALPSEELSLKAAYEKQLKDKVMPDLDKILGHDRYTLAVNAQLDFSQKKIVSTTLGDQHKVEESKKGETYDNSSKTKEPADKKGGKEVSMPSLQPGSGSGASTNYHKEDVKVKFESDKTTKEVVMPAGSLMKLSASLAVDKQLTPQQKTDWENWMKNALGIDESRGDSVFVMENATFVAAAQMPNLMGDYESYRRTHSTSDLSTGASSQVMIYAMAASVLLLLGLIATFLVKQNRVHMDKSSLILGASSSSTSSTIADLVNDKSGKSSADTQTTLVNNRAELEKLAKEKPTKVAELLKQTWLSEKERG